MMTRCFVSLTFSIFAFLGCLTWSPLSYADSTIGRCQFFGDRPSSGSSIGGMKVYHNGTGRITGSRGRQQIYRVDGGDVWVIYSKQSQKERYVFLGGSVQTCDKNI